MKSNLFIIIFIAAAVIIYSSLVLAFTATFTWTPTVSSTATGYNLYMTTSSGSYTYGGAASPNYVTSVSGGSSNTYQQTGILAGSYFWVMTSIDGAGDESGPSNQVTCTFPGPTCIFSLSGISIGGGTTIK